MIMLVFFIAIVLWVKKYAFFLYLNFSCLSRSLLKQISACFLEKQSIKKKAVIRADLI